MLTLQRSIVTGNLLMKANGAFMGECCCCTTGIDGNVIVDPALKTTYHIILTDGTTPYEFDIILGQNEEGIWGNEDNNFSMTSTCVGNARTFTFVSLCFPDLPVTQETPVGVFNVDGDEDCFGADVPATLTVTEV